MVRWRAGGPSGYRRPAEEFLPVAVRAMTERDNSRAALGPARPRHLQRAPITEALIDFRVQPAEGLSTRKLEEAARRIEKEYPARSAVKTVQAKLGRGRGV